MGLDVAAVEGGHVPVKLTVLVGLGLQGLERVLPDALLGLERVLPDALLGPAVEPGRAGSPRTITTGDVAPGSAGTQHPPVRSTQRMPLMTVRWSL